MAHSSSLLNVLSRPARSRSGSFSRSLSPCVRGGESSGLSRSPSGLKPPQLSTLAASATHRSRPTSRSELATGRVEHMLSPIPHRGVPEIHVRSLGSSTLQQGLDGITGTGDLISQKRAEAFSTAACPVPNDELNVAVGSNLMSGTNLTEHDVMMLHFYSKFNPSPVSMGNFLSHGNGTGKLEDSFLFLRREIPVRLANSLSELLLLPDELKENKHCKMIQEEFAMSFKEIVEFENLPNDPETHAAFNETLFRIRQRHIDTVPKMAEAILSTNVSDLSDGTNKSIQYFLDRLYMSWISIKMLISHHKLTYCPDESKTKAIGMVGSIDPNCDVAKVAEAAFENAQFLCDQMYMDAPKLKLQVLDAANPQAKSVQFSYIPSHLYHMFFEVFKNSMRATMEFHEGEDSIPEIEVQIVKGKSDISIKISDNGGGMSRTLADKIFMYLYTSAGQVKLPGGDMGGTTSTSTPMHGLGYGLPLSRLYARYLGGDIKVSSCDGLGTDAFIYLKSIKSHAHETLPIYNATSVNKLTNTSTQVADWTTD